MKALDDYLKKRHKTHIIFDFDATVFHLLLPWEYHFKHIKDELKALDKNIWNEYEQDWTADVAIQHKYLNKYGSKVKEIFDRNSQFFEKEYLQGVRKNDELIEYIRKDNKYKKYIWSSNSYHSVEKVLKENDLFDKFEKVIGRESVEIIKPQIFGFKQLHDGKTPISDYLFVGDSSNDEGAAKALGMDFFKVSF